MDCWFFYCQYINLSSIPPSKYICQQLRYFHIKGTCSRSHHHVCYWWIYFYYDIYHSLVYSCLFVCLCPRGHEMVIFMRGNIHLINLESVRHTADVKCWLNKWMNESPKADHFHREIVPYFDFAENSNHCLETPTWMSDWLLNSSTWLSDRNPTFNIVHNIPSNFSNQIWSKLDPCFNHLK